uniref:Reverse transcriptase domain-containing protein n=1 Tax=Spongospora subterranea TaxID=70186 RepID=A0A0H5QEJ5_9EUKA
MLVMVIDPCQWNLCPNRISFRCPIQAMFSSHIQGAEILFTLDLNKGYWQLQMTGDIDVPFQTRVLVSDRLIQGDLNRVPHFQRVRWSALSVGSTSSRHFRDLSPT